MQLGSWMVIDVKNVMGEQSSNFSQVCIHFTNIFNKGRYLSFSRFLGDRKFLKKKKPWLRQQEPILWSFSSHDNSQIVKSLESLKLTRHRTKAKGTQLGGEMDYLPDQLVWMDNGVEGRKEAKTQMLLRATRSRMLWRAMITN